MPDLDPSARLYLAFATGLGVALVGAVNALFRLRLAGQLLATAVGGGVGVGLVALVEPALAGTAGLVGGALAAVWLVVRSAAVRAVVEVFRSPRVRWAGVAVLGLAVAVSEVYRFEQDEQARADRDLFDMAEMAYRPTTVPDPSARVATDAGSPVAVEHAVQPRTDYELRAVEDAVLAAFPKRDQIIRRAPANDNSNCHGWVFTGGRYVVRGREVDRILAENRYAPVTDPRPGDVCVYRGDNSAVSHTAVVRGAFPDGTVLVEGKWGWLGVFLHPADASCYGTHFAYYRTDRGGHLLAGATSSGMEPMAKLRN